MIESWLALQLFIYLFFWFLDSCLNPADKFGNQKESEMLMNLLLCWIEDKCISQEISVFCKVFTGLSASQTDPWKFNFLISLYTVFLLTGEKWKPEKRWDKHLITRMLGWPLYLSIGLPVGYLDNLFFLENIGLTTCQ